MRVTRHVILHGRVQGVNFREAMRAQAERLSVTGWVRNRSDGTLEATVQGAPESVGRVLEWVRRGPPAARVTQVDIDEGEGDFASFERLPSL